MLSGCSQETMISLNATPEVIKTYIQQHFPNQKILQIVEDKDGLELDYDIILEGNVSLELSKNGDLKSAKSQTSLPVTIIPVKILQYVQTNYTDNTILSIDIDNKDQEIKLNNGLELIFNKNGNFIKLDH